MLYLLLWIMILVISFKLFQKASGTMSILRPNLLSLTFYYSLLVSSFIGSLLIVMNIDDHYMIKRIANEDYRLIGFLIISFIMVFMPLSMLMLSKLAGFNAEKEFNSYIEAPVFEDPSLKKGMYLMFVGLTFLSIASIGYTILNLKVIPILELVKGSGNAAEMRIEASRGFGGNTIIRNVFALTLTSILSMVTFIYSHKTRELKWVILFLITFPAAIFMQVYDLAKSPIFFYMLMFLLLLIYTRIIRLTWFKVAVIGLTGVFGLIGIYVVVQGVSGLDEILAFNRGPLGRLILSQVAGFYMHLDLFGDRLPYLMGKSLPSSILGLYDVEQIRSARLAMEVYFPERVEAGTAGVLNTLFAGEAFANFGYLGVILGTFYVAIYIQVVYIIFVRLPKDPLFVTLFVFFTVNIPRVVIGGFADFLINILWVAILIILIGPYLALFVYRDFIKERFKLVFNR